MLFLKEEKVFSLAKSVAAPPYGDITALFQEFYCYLFVAALYREGEGVGGIHWTISNISDKNFRLPSGSYNEGLGKMLTKGLQDRYYALSKHPDLNGIENTILLSLDGIFTSDTSWFAQLSGKDILSVAMNRSFTEEMTVIAQYLAVMLGQHDYPAPVSVPNVYLSIFGNIHVARDFYVDEITPYGSKIILEEPMLRYGSMSADGSLVTALWSLMSSQISSLSENEYPGDSLSEKLSGFVFLGESNEFEKELPAPRYASSLYLQRVMGLGSMNPVFLSAMFYRDFLYGSNDTLTVSRTALLAIVIDLMMKKMGETHQSHLFSDMSFSRKLSAPPTLYSKTPKRPMILQFALEALDSSDELNDDQDKETIVADPQTDDNGYDPSNPLPAIPMGNPVLDKDTIDLLSFDKSGEGVNENLYRAAVVALNDRLRSDDTLPITSEIKQSLDYWVNGFLYRTAISATKEQIAFLNLQNYLKILVPKG